MVQCPVLSPCAQSGDCIPLEFIDIWFPLAAGLWRAGTLTCTCLGVLGTPFQVHSRYSPGTWKEWICVAHSGVPLSTEEPWGSVNDFGFGSSTPILERSCGFVNRPPNLKGPSSRLPALLNTSDIPVSTFVCFSCHQSPNSRFVTCRKFCLEGKQAICRDPTGCSELHCSVPRWRWKAVVTRACSRRLERLWNTRLSDDNLINMLRGIFSVRLKAVASQSRLRFIFAAVHILHLTLRHLTLFVPCFCAHAGFLFRIRILFQALYFHSNWYWLSRIQPEQAAVVCLASRLLV